MGAFIAWTLNLGPLVLVLVSRTRIADALGLKAGEGMLPTALSNMAVHL